jgi:putative endonuclease
VGRNAPGAVGKTAEHEALAFLLSQGLQLVARNYRCRGGEIDLVMLHHGCLVFVEVRYRQSTRFLTPALTVDLHKQRKILCTAAMFLARHRRFAQHTVRFDVVAITGAVQRSTQWLQDAFRPTDSTL